MDRLVLKEGTNRRRLCTMFRIPDMKHDLRVELETKRPPGFLGASR